MDEPQPRWRDPMTDEERARYERERTHEFEDAYPLRFVGELIEAVRQ